MRTVKVKSAALLRILKKNRDGHRAVFEKAFEGYRKECVRVLEENLAALKSGKKHVVRFEEMPPEDHTTDYNRVIAMLEMSVDKNVELAAIDFSQYVQDDWAWKQQWSVSNSKYGV